MLIVQGPVPVMLESEAEVQLAGVGATVVMPVGFVQFAGTTSVAEVPAEPLEPVNFHVNVLLELPAVTLVDNGVTLKLLVAARYGPTNGPPPPTGGEPAGCRKSVAVSAKARAKLILPLPV